MYRYTFAVLLASTILCAGCASTASEPTAASPDSTPVILDNSEVFTHYSPTLDHTFGLRVALPGSYGQRESAAYPLMIKVDGQWDFPLAVGVYNGITYDGQMPEAVFVGIDWGSVEGDIHAIRARDLLPAPLPHYPDGGHAKTFLDVLVNEIIPELEARFRLNGERVLIGGSWGASFATYALLEQPQDFSGAIAIAGNYDIAPQVLEQQIQTLRNTDALDGKRLYVGVGSADPLAPSVASMVETLQEAELPGFELHFEQLEGFGHSGMNSPGYASGYQHIFRRPDISVPQTELNALSGTYRSQGEQSSNLVFVATNSGLTAQMSNGFEIPLRAQSPTEFYHPGLRFDVRFDNDKVYVERPFSSHEYERTE